jgi:hypothetical protein
MSETFICQSDNLKYPPNIIVEHFLITFYPFVQIRWASRRDALRWQNDLV